MARLGGSTLGACREPPAIPVSTAARRSPAPRCASDACPRVAVPAVPPREGSLVHGSGRPARWTARLDPESRRECAAFGGRNVLERHDDDDEMESGSLSEEEENCMFSSANNSLEEESEGEIGDDRSETEEDSDQNQDSEQLMREAHQLATRLSQAHDCVRVLDIISIWPKKEHEGGTLSSAELTVTMNRLRALVKTCAAEWEKVSSHPGMAVIETSFVAHRQEIQLQTLTGMLTIISSMKGRTPGMVKAAFAQLVDLSPQLQTASKGTIASLCASLATIHDTPPVSVVRRIHEKVARDIGEYDPVTVASVLRRLAFIRPLPPEAAVAVFWDRALQSVPQLAMGGIKTILVPFVYFRPPPPVRLQDCMYEKCMELMPELDATSIGRLLVWMFRLQYPIPRDFWEVIEPAIVSVVQVETTDRDVQQVIEGYSGLGGANPRVLHVLLNKILPRASSLQPRGLAGTLRALATLEYKDGAALEALADRVVELTPRLTMKTISAIAWSLSSLKSGHDVLKELALAVAKMDTAMPAEVAKLVCSLGRLGVRVAPLMNKLCYFLDEQSLKDMDAMSIAYLSNAVSKLRHRDDELVSRIAGAVEWRYDRLNFEQAMTVTKCCALAAPRKNLLQKQFDDRVEHELRTADASVMVQILELYGVLKRRQGNEKVDMVVQHISGSVDKLKLEELARVMRWTGKMNLQDEGLLAALTTAVSVSYTSMSAEQLSWVMWGFCKVGHPIEEELFDALSRQISANVESLHLHDLCRFLYACARSQRCDPDVLSRVADRISTSQASDLGFPGISILLWSFGKLDLKHAGVLRWADDQLPSIIGAAQPQAYANIFWAFRRLDHRPSASFIRAAVKGVGRTMDMFKPYEISTVLYGLVHWDVELGDQWMASTISYMEEHIEDFDGNALCNMLWAMTRRGCKPGKSVIARACYQVMNDIHRLDYYQLGNFLWACGRAGFKPTPLLEEVATRVARIAHRLEPRALSSVVWGFAVCQFLSNDMLQAVKVASIDRFQEFSAFQLSGLLWGMSTLGWKGRKFYANAARRAADCIDDMTTVDLFTTVWAFARSGRPANQFLLLAYDRLSQEMNKLRAHQIVSLAWAIGKIGRCNNDVMEALAVAAEEKMAELDVKGISTLLWSFATVSYDPGATFDKLVAVIGSPGRETFPNWLSLTHTVWSCARLLHPIPQYVEVAGLQLLEKHKDAVQWKGGMSTQGPVDGRHLMLCLWAMSVFGDHSSEFVQGLADRVNKVDVLETMQDEQKQQLAQCLLVAAADGKVSPLECLPKHYKAEAMASWRGVVKWNSERELSTFHRNVTSTLHQLGVKYEDKHVSDDLCVCLDIFAHLPEGSPESEEFKGVAIELYGPQHLSSNLYKPVGKVVLRQKMIQDRGYRLVPLLYTEWMDLQSQGGVSSMKESYVGGKLFNAGVLERNLFSLPSDAAQSSQNGDSERGTRELVGLRLHEQGPESEAVSGSDMGGEAMDEVFSGLEYT
ncbi:unnamed protein product [Ostreobium quekettii]|uniref:RAP domain-containing protein n=1 Tax=Ostreobium quekettii TaxID=121088 RepID=A0A8S1IK21_9CHLO|nr:unnamed protein product [Ostreobium quekettii]